MSRLLQEGDARECRVADMLREWLGPPSNTGVLRLHAGASVRVGVSVRFS